VRSGADHDREAMTADGLTKTRNAVDAMPVMIATFANASWVARMRANVRTARSV
jgi:hypothetical protein